MTVSRETGWTCIGLPVPLLRSFLPLSPPHTIPCLPSQGFRDDGQSAELQAALAFLASPESKDAGAALEWCMRLGLNNFDTMALLR